MYTREEIERKQDILGMIALFLLIIPFIWIIIEGIFFPDETYEDPYGKQSSIEILAKQENYSLYLDGEEVDFNTIYEFVGDGNRKLYGINEEKVRNAFVDNKNKRIDYFNNPIMQAQTLSQNAGYSVLLNNEEIQLDNINLNNYKVFIDYDNNEIILTEK